MAVSVQRDMKMVLLKITFLMHMISFDFQPQYQAEPMDSTKCVPRMVSVSALTAPALTLLAPWQTGPDTPA